jgi:hypothetical protein
MAVDFLIVLEGWGGGVWTRGGIRYEFTSYFFGGENKKGWESEGENKRGGGEVRYEFITYRCAR